MVLRAKRTCSSAAQPLSQKFDEALRLGWKQTRLGYGVDGAGRPLPLRQNRARFAIEVATAIAGQIGADKTAIRLSPGITMWGIDEGAEGPDLHRHLVAELDKLVSPTCTSCIRATSSFWPTCAGSGAAS